MYELDVKPAQHGGDIRGCCVETMLIPLLGDITICLRS